MKRIIPLCLLFLSTIPYSQAGVVFDNCAHKTVSIEQEIEEACRNGYFHKVKGLKKALNKINEACINGDSQEQIALGIQEVESQLKEIDREQKKIERKFKKANQTADNKLLLHYQKKLEDKQAMLDALNAELNLYKKELKLYQLH